MDPVLVGLIGIAALLVLILLEMPVAFAMAVVGFVGFGCLITWDSAYSMLVREIFSQFSFYPLSVIVLFVLMGSYSFASGMSRRLYDSANVISGKLPSGLAVATILACSGFAAICGSTAATAATIGRVALPEMKRFKYSDTLATGCVASAGSVGILIPPSTVFVVYAILSEQSVGELFASGFLPGILLTVMFLVTVWLVGWGTKSAPAGSPTSLSQKLRAIGRIADIFGLFLFSIGGLFLGWFSPSQAAGVGAAGALVLGLIHRELTLPRFVTATKEGLRTACMIIMVIAGASVFGKFMAVTSIPVHLTNWISSSTASPFWIMAMICVMFVIGGFFIDAMALIVLTVPIVYPAVVGMGYDPVWFGTTIVLLSQVAVLTPPVGINVYVVKGLAPDVPIEVIFKGTFPFLISLVLMCLLVILFPDLVLILPKLLRI